MQNSRTIWLVIPILSVNLAPAARAEGLAGTLATMDANNRIQGTSTNSWEDGIVASRGAAFQHE